ncbi:non-hydrolyzing UDP-N-acetylglucosamine 2-epimerase [Thiolapillus brandeum]|uniref:UDP-N-acetylglucosamine 2-epimerase n=1 Tax=Thiolapillus brandeum TaxID=1076588 RepID=A0A7U6GKP4_9GAMM|nr:UDP-N-acetylglucosamine 2-epimerase (non-hydrolyzing) [Thiolapillus brandeum]BAO45446.1 UDP-N-acetylglucosamine 2-epimerase [Thiolapillus brandeum]
MAGLPIKVLCVAGARPNFPKIAPLMKVLGETEGFEVHLVHTGQHYDDALSRVFFEDLKIPKPDLDLEVGSASHALQTAEVMRRFEPVLEQEQPQAVVVVGDVNSTIACALVVSKFPLKQPFMWRGKPRHRPVMIHVEAGLRSFDEEMPEEINRRLTDTISDLLFVTEMDAVTNLRNEGVAEERIHFVGNVMIDTLLAARDKAMQSGILEELELEKDKYALLTLHRPSNVDDSTVLGKILGALDEIAAERPIVFPVHPRTKPRIADAGVALSPERWKLIDPVGYLDFLRLMSSAHLVITDSGGIQEETTVLGVPCMTLRENTERPVTLSEGTNRLVGIDPDAIRASWKAISQDPPVGRVPRYWDGQAAKRIVAVLAREFGVQ